MNTTVDDLNQILDIGARLASSSDLEEVLGMVINGLRDVLSADRASVFQYDAETHEFFATSAHGLASDLRLPADKGIIGEAGKAREIINIPDAYADARFNQAVDKATGYHTRCLLTIPLVDFTGALIGVAQVLNKHEDAGGVFDSADEQLAGHIANQAAVALKRASLLESELHKQKLEADLDIARKIQQSCLPDELPTFERYDIAGASDPADETGGDAFDVIDLHSWGGETARRAEADALIFMADATGHGVGPALSVVQVLAMLRVGARLGASPDEIARETNAQLCEDLPLGRFVTVFVGVLDLGRDQIRYASAGQAPLVRVPADGSEPDVRAANVMPMGIMDQFDPDAVEPVHMAVGDRFLLLSDGYYEAADPDGNMLGEAGVLEVVREYAGSTSQELLHALQSRVKAFAGAQPQADDQTGIIITRTA